MRYHQVQNKEGIVNINANVQLLAQSQPAQNKAMSRQYEPDYRRIEFCQSTARMFWSCSIPRSIVAFDPHNSSMNNTQWYDLYNYTTSAALDTGTLIAAALVYLCLVLPGLSQRYRSNPLHPNPFVWETPEYCYNSTIV